MNKTVNINLAGMAFIMDDNAYEVLHQYLEALRHKFVNAAEREEIMNDIEARMAEMLNAKKTPGKQVINIEDINEVVGIMGRPEDIAGDEEPQAGSAKAQTGTQERVQSGPVKRRLFRDPDDKKVSGVISGLCHYFGINDPVWLRLAFVGLCFLSFGTMILIYFILMIVIPEADTAAEKLQMKGEPVNISTIEKEVKEAATRAGDSIRDFGSNSTFFEKAGHHILTIIMGITKVIAGIAAFAGLVLLAVLVASLFGVSIAGGGLFTQAPAILFDGPNTILLFKTGLIFFVGSIVAVAVYAVLRLVFGKRTQVRPLKWVLLATWWTGVILIGVAGYKIGASYKSSATVKYDVPVMQPAGGHLMVQLSDSVGNKYMEEDQGDHEDFNFSLFGFEVNGTDIEGLDKITIGEPSLQLMPSPNDSFYIYTFITARGSSKQDADKNTSYVIYKVMQTDTLVSLPALTLLDGKGKWRAQNVKVRIAIPEGKKLSFADNIDHWAATVKGNSFYDDTYFNNTTWTTENGRVKCLEGENHYLKAEDEKEEEVILEKNKQEKDDYYKGKVEVQKNGEQVKVQIQEGDKQKVITIRNKDGKEQVEEVRIEGKK